ncbi:MAG: DUF1554 domain-containing protein [Polyangiaceae bacterium]
MKGLLVLCVAYAVIGCGGEEFTSAGGGGTGGNSADAGGSSGAAGIAGTPSNIVFVTSEKLKGDFGGPAQADTRCNSAAQKVGLAGTFVAWIAATSQPIGKRLTHDGGWKLRDGSVVVNTRQQLASGTLSHAIDVFEDGTPVGGESTQVWTGIRSNAELANDNCGDWQDAGIEGQTGESNSVGNAWTEAAVVACDTERRLYCFQN